MYNILVASANKAVLKAEVAIAINGSSGNADNADLISYVDAQIDQLQTSLEIMTVSIEGGFTAAGGTMTLQISP